MKSLLATIGSLATNSLFANEPATAWGSLKAPCGTLSRAQRTSLTAPGSSFAPSGISLAATTTSTVCAIARCTSDSRFLIAEKTTIAASIAPIAARITNTIGRFIYVPLLARPVDSDFSTGPHAQNSIDRTPPQPPDLRGGDLSPRLLSHAPSFDYAGLRVTLTHPTESKSRWR